MKARQTATWWRRVGAVAVALAVFTFVYLDHMRWTNPSWMGRELFEVLSGFGMVCALLTGPMVATDCLARERRDGTLGLLFLTPLRSYEVVLGKMAAGSIDMLFAALATLPVLSIPLLMGGVSLVQFTCTAMALLNLIYLSLAIGVLASSLFVSGRLALALALVVLGGLTLLLPLIGEVNHIHLGRKEGTAALLYSVSPLQTMIVCLDRPSEVPNVLYWINMSGIFGLGLLCLFIACVRTARAWRDLPASGLQRWCQQRWEGWSRGSSGWRLRWQRRMLDRNVFAWLEGRERLEGRILWGIIGVATLIWLQQYFMHRRSWLDADVALLWPTFAHYILCVWIAIRAPRRLADDKQSGALELLLCTPLKEPEIVRGSMRFLWRRFGRAVATTVAFGVIGVWLYLTKRHWPEVFWREDVVQLAFCGLLVFPLQAYGLARVGLYQGLAQGNSLRATFWSLGQLTLLPWFIFIGYMFAWEITDGFGIFRRYMSEEIAFASWAGCHLLVCVAFLVHASWHLHAHFRFLAAQPVRLGWWKRCLDRILGIMVPSQSSARKSISDL